MGVGVVERTERTYGKPMEEIIAVERPKQKAARRDTGKHVENAATKP